MPLINEHQIEVFYRPDNYPDWISWKKIQHSLEMIGDAGAVGSGGLPRARAGFVPRIPLGKPQNATDSLTKRSLRRGFDFQFRFIGRGHMAFDRFRVHAQKLVENSRA